MKKFIQDIQSSVKGTGVFYKRVALAAAVMALLGAFSFHLQDIWLQLEHEKAVARATQLSAQPSRRLPTPRYRTMRKQNHVLVSEQKPDLPPALPQDSPVPIFYRVDTGGKPVVFVTIDDGVFKEPTAAEFMVNLQLPFTLFLTVHDIQDDYGFFQKLDGNGQTVENHTISHPHMKRLKLGDQQKEICDTSDDFANRFGRRPVLFRPPYGEYNDDTVKAAAACGIKGIVMWNTVVDKGRIAFQEERDYLKPGDIILLHFRHELHQDIQTVLDQARKQNMFVGDLEDWL